jgi:hypothetical protein
VPSRIEFTTFWSIQGRGGTCVGNGNSTPQRGGEKKIQVKGEHGSKDDDEGENEERRKSLRKRVEGGMLLAGLTYKPRGRKRKVVPRNRFKTSNILEDEKLAIQRPNWYYMEISSTRNK